MLFDDDQQLAERIVRTLSKEPQLSAAVLTKRVNKTKQYSIQGVYKELKKLEQGGVVVKEARQYSLRLPWVLDMVDFSQQLSDTYMTNAASIMTLPTAQKKQRWRFTNLQQLNNFWSQVLVFLMQHVDAQQLYSVMQHPWYHLLYTEQEQQYIEAVDRTKTRLYIVNRGKTELDRWATQFWDQPHIEYSFTPTIFKQVDAQTYLNVIGHYVLTVRLDTNTTQAIQKLYAVTTHAEVTPYNEVVRLLGLRIKARMTLELHPVRAKKIRRVFQRHFGITQSS